MELDEIELKMSAMCDLLGVSAQGIRLYEKHGAIHSFKYEGNGYRYYYFEDIGPAIQARSLRKLGLPLAQCAPESGAQPVEALDEALLTSRRQLEGNIRYQQALLRRIDETREEAALAADHLYQFAPCVRPPMDYLFCERDGAILSDPAGRKLIRSWSEQFPFVRFCPMVPAEGIGPDVVSRVGFCLFRRDRDFVPTRDHPQVLHLPEVDCVGGVIRVSRKTVDYLSVVQPGLTYLEEQGYRLTGDIYTVLLAAKVQAGDDVFDYYYGWYPCEKR